MLTPPILLGIASALLIAGGLLLAAACARSEPEPSVRRYQPFFSSEEWVHVEPVVRQAFEGYW